MDTIITIITIIIGIVVVLFLYYFIKELISVVVKKWPAVIWVVGLIVGLLLGFEWHWIAGIVGGFMVMGILYGLQESGTKKCPNCGSYDTEMTHSEMADGRKIEMWKCNKCGQQIVFY